MSNALANQIESLRAVVKALKPETGDDPFTEADGSIPVDQEPPVRHRVFDIRADESAPLTQAWFGTAERSVLGRLRVELNYDVKRDFKTHDRVFVEDTDQIVSALESPDARVTNVDQVTFVDRTIAARGDAQEFQVVTLMFEVLYRVAL